jgi:TolA-binding protein
VRIGYTAAAVAASVVVTALFSLLLNGEVLGSFLLTGFSCSALVAWVITGRALRAQDAEIAGTLREAQLRARIERLEAMRQVMREVNHHVNTLSNNRQLIDLEYARSGQLSPQTLGQLKGAVAATTQAIRALNDATIASAPDASPDGAYHTGAGRTP